MRRRDFLGVLSSAALAWPDAAFAQQSDRMRRIGVLMGYPENDREGQGYIKAFQQALTNFGWGEGRNVQIDVRWATASDADARERFAKELIALQPELILAHGTPTTATLQQLTRVVPIVFLNVSDPIGSGFVKNFSNPGGNVTGFITMEPTMAGKWVELLKVIAPQVTRCALLFNSKTAPYAQYFLSSFSSATATFGVEAIIANVRDIDELEGAIATLAREPNGGLIVMPDTFMTVHREKITTMAARLHLPAVYPFRFYPANGGLLSYGNDTIDSYRRSATYADRILRGAKPAELPVQGPSKFELVINLKTAKAMGLTVPPSLLVSADEIIE